MSENVGYSLFKKYLKSVCFRAVHSSSHHATTIHIVDMPGFQNPNLSGRKYAASFDDLLNNYAQERLQMMFYNTVFVTEQDRYAQVWTYMYIWSLVVHGNHALSVRLSVRPPVCPSVCLSVCLSVRPSVCVGI